MDTIDKWLKSLRLHKYTHLFKSLSYEQMLNLEEKYLIEKDVTKGARNKMLVSVKKLNLRQERLFNMMDDLDQENISMKEALNALKDMLITPIPPPPQRTSSSIILSSYSSCSSLTASFETAISSPTGASMTGSITDLSGSGSLVSTSAAAPTTASTSSSAASSSSGSTSSSSSRPASTDSALSGEPARRSRANGGSLISTMDSDNEANLVSMNSSGSNNININDNTITSKTNNYFNPYELTYLFIETLEKVAHRLIESAGMEDNACHGIMAAIVEECLKHNSFTKEQKAKVAGFKQHFMKGQRAQMASFKQHYTKGREAKMANFKQQLRQQLQHQQQRSNSYNHHQQQQHQLLQHHNQQEQQQQQQQQQLQQQQQQSNHNHNHYYHYHHNHWSGPIQPPSLSASLSTMGSTPSTSDEEDRQTYREYSLLGPGKTFELPCLRALAATEKHKQRSQLLTTPIMPLEKHY